MIAARRLALILLSLTAPATEIAAQHKQGNEKWPFGIDEAAGNPSTTSRRDLFNLGPLGAKAWDADLPEPAATMTSGRRMVETSGEPGADVGPKRLVVRALFGKGPAQNAGLDLDDVITGINGQPFANGCLQPLADAMQAAEAGDGKLELMIERGGAARTLNVTLHKLGKPALLPEKGKMIADLQDDALAWLASHQVGGGYPETLSGTNGAVVQTCLAGLAWISGGNSLKRGKYKSNLQDAVSFVQRGLNADDPMKRLGGDANWDQSTWGEAHAAIFFGELCLQAKNKDLQKVLQQIVDTLCKRQELSGGYGHGPGGKNALGYIELNIMAAYVACGLSLGQQCGCKVDQKVVDKLLGYAQESASDDGGVGYATGEGQKGFGNIGRTAGTWLGAVGLGRKDDPFVQKMASYARAHIADVMGGHASLQQHFLLAGLAAKALGPEASAAYWNGNMRRDLTLARTPDGAFEPRPWHESLSMQTNTDVTMGEVWSTASWAIVLGAHRDDNKGGLRGWCKAP